MHQQKWAKKSKLDLIFFLIVGGLNSEGQFVYCLFLFSGSRIQIRPWVFGDAKLAVSNQFKTPTESVRQMVVRWTAHSLRHYSFQCPIEKKRGSFGIIESNASNLFEIQDANYCLVFVLLFCPTIQKTISLWKEVQFLSSDAKLNFDFENWNNVYTVDYWLYCLSIGK